MLNAHASASPRAPRGKHQQPQIAPAQAQQGNGAKTGQRRPKGNRAHNSTGHLKSAGMSPSRLPITSGPALAESAVFTTAEAQLPTGPRPVHNHARSQPSIDRVFSPQGDNEGGPRSLSSTPVKNQDAYAGPTFHASPAPSDLPLPKLAKFLSRSVPAKTQVGPPTPPLEDTSDSASSPSPAASPSRPGIAVPQRNLASPLDLLFKADRAEKAKVDKRSPASVNPFDSFSSGRPQHYKQDSYNAPFPIELDGENGHMYTSPPLAAHATTSRSVTDPCKVPQLKDLSHSPINIDPVQELISRLAMAPKNHTTSTPPGQSSHSPGARDGTPSPSPHSTDRAVSGPSTPAATTQIYGNRNLSPLFQAAKADSPKRNSGLRTEITADSPMVGQGTFQNFPSVSSPPTIDPNTFSRGYAGNGGGGAMGARRGSAPYVQPYRELPHNYRRPMGLQGYQSGPDSTFHKAPRGPASNSVKAAAHAAPAPSKKPASSMMSFVPSSVAAKKHSVSKPSTAPSPTLKTSTVSDTSGLEQDLKQMLNLHVAGNASSVR
jgi:hypothetical protein